MLHPMFHKEVSYKEEDKHKDQDILEGMLAKLSVTPVIKKDTLVTIAHSRHGIHQCFDGLLDPPWTSWGQLVPADTTP